MERSFFLVVVVFLVCCANLFASAHDWRVQRLNQFQQKYNNSQADIIFLIDVSGSVSSSGFNTEKEFVKSMLSKISVQPIASRVAVVTFGKDIQENIDYIDYDGLDRNKCTFTKEFAAVKHRYGPATNMKGALLQAKKILDDAKRHSHKRQHVNTVAVLLTDGYWNYGGEPYGTSRVLQDRNRYDVELFAVGVGYSLKSQLEKIANSKSNVIIARDFSDFEGLATRIRGDQIEKLYQPIHKSNCGHTCDQNAICSCGTISGIYTCACLPGYHGSGKPGHCYKCPRGQYKTFSSPDPCKPCPANSITTEEGSTHLRDCKCRSGFVGNPDQGKACKPVECIELSNTIIANGKVTSCGKYYRETCTFTCNDNYHVANEVATTRKMTCLIDGKWSHAVPLCVATTCQKPFNPPHMTSSCSGDKVGDKCTFTCAQGYNLVGANERTCRNDGQWSHSLPHCQVVTCPTVRKIDNVNIYPVHCMTKTTKFTDACAYSCKPGFKYVSGDQKRVCQHDGTWSGVELVCKDLTPPTISCPESIFAETELGQPYKEIDYLQPTIIDNSIAGSDDITVLQDPPTIKSPYKFSIGVTTVNFTAVDQSGNSDSCTFRVEVIDRELPTFSYCPSDITITVDNSNDLKKTVSWDDPEFSDNSGVAQMIHASVSNPHDFVVGPVHHVHYKVQDASRNVAECNFLVQVEPKSCPAHNPPINGALSCTNVATFGKYCTISCQNPYTFNGPHAYGYICGTDSHWRAVPPTFTLPWPDCTSLQPPQGMSQNMKFFYFTGACDSGNDAQNEIKRNFLVILNQFIRHQGGCAMNQLVCDANKVQVKCGKTQVVSGRKRSIQNELIIDVEVDVKSSNTDTARQQAIVLRDYIKTESKKPASLVRTFTSGKQTMTLERVEAVGSITGICDDGQVFDPSNYKPDTPCVSCMSGSYFSTKNGTCEKCPKGTYTEKPGLLGCPACPTGTTTATPGTTNSTHCKQPCEKGYFSKDGLAPCQPCSRGYYQPDRESKSCVKCPGATTAPEGSTRQDQCRMMCPKGMYSKTGMEPCTACPIGFYQPVAGQRQCIQCLNKLSTYGTGTEQVSQCQNIDNCVSSPCLNGGVCSNEWNDFSCTCKPGYRGKRCEEEKNECADKPCYGNSVCVDEVNGFSCLCPKNYHGKYCSEKYPSCSVDLCQNGGACGETPEGPLCHCKPGWTGKFCERTINECKTNPCTNGGVCLDSHRGFSCVCKPGFTGPRCMENIDDCEQNNVCKNGATCVDAVNGFSCACPAGYSGERCEVNIDDCASMPCRNGGLCVDGVNGYKCHCSAQFYGNTCEKRYTSNDFDLSFNREVQGFAETSFYQDLHEFTVAFWMMSSSQDMESGTVASYAWGNEEDGFQDNAFVVRDPSHMTLVVLGEEIPTNISAADDDWHHVVLTWSNANGRFTAYKDGILISQGENVQKGKVIPANGAFILGQEQDEVGRNFSAGEAFNGKLSQFNLWNKVLSKTEIEEMSKFRCDHVAGNVIAWTDFSELTSDDVTKEHVFCKVTTKFSDWLISTANSPCPGGVRAQCLSSGKLSIKELNLIDTTCSPLDKFKCGNQKKNDPDNQVRCPASMMIRYECPYNPNNDCSSKNCNGRGSCMDSLSGYICLCRDGYTGKDCETSVSCDHVKRIANGYVNPSGSTAHFSCKAGYQLQGANALTCHAGKYNGQVPTCQDVDECQSNPCGSNSKCVNTIGSFKCDCLPGFTLSTPTICVDINECATNNGNCQDKCLNSQGSYSCGCRAGYRISVDKRSCEDIDECASSSTNNCMHHCFNTRGSHTCECRIGYKKSGDQCIAVPCPQLRSPVNGRVTQGYGSYNTKVLYSCNSESYRLNGPNKRRCLANGQWSGKEPFCEAVDCGNLPSPYNGQASKSGNTYTFKCLGGYRLIGSSVRTCLTSGDWSGEQPRCIQYHCPVLSAPKNGVVVGSSYVVNAAALFNCNHGYMLKNKNDAIRVCQSDGSWSGNQAECVAIDCGAPDAIPNGAITGTSFKYNDKITYSCQAGYGLSGRNVRTCQLNGEWSGFTPACLFNSCGYPGDPLNGHVNGSDFSFGKSVSFYCNHGYRLVGDQSSQCLNGGKWSKPLPICQEILCPAPTTPINGVKTGNHYGVGSTITFDCHPGYSLQGSRKITCADNSQWSASTPTCVSGVCGSAKLVGPTGSITSPNYPNSYTNNDYCRWKIVVSQSKKVALDLSSFKTELSVDQMEIRDGKSGELLSVLSGALRQPLLITSSSNEMDVLFHSNAMFTADGFEANYFSSSCGGQITSLGAIIQTPGFPSNYDKDLSCSWQIVIPNEKFKLEFDHFSTTDSHDILEAWSHLTIHNSGTKIGSYYGNRGSLLVIKSTSVMYLKFTSDSFFQDRGFRATITKDTSI